MSLGRKCTFHFHVSFHYNPENVSGCKWMHFLYKPSNLQGFNTIIQLSCLVQNVLKFPCVAPELRELNRAVTLWMRQFKFRSVQTNTHKHVYMSIIVSSPPVSKLLNILFRFQLRFKQSHWGASPWGSSSRSLKSLIRDAYLSPPTGRVLTTAYLQPWVLSHSVTATPQPTSLSRRTVTHAHWQTKRTSPQSPPLASSLPQCVYNCCHILTRLPNIRIALQRVVRHRAFSPLVCGSVRRASQRDGFSDGSVCLGFFSEFSEQS